MSKKCYFTSKLLGIGLISPTLHYGIFARDWWETVSLDSKDKDVVFIVLFRLYMRVGCNLNGKDFIITVLQNNKNIYKPGFQCTCENISSKIEPYPSTAINSCYKEVFGTKTEYSGIAVIGFEDEKIIQQLRNEIEFFPIFLRIEKLSVVISGFGYSSKDGYYGAGEDDQCITEIYHNANKIEQFTGLTPDDVWKKVGIYKKFSGSHIFGIIHETTQNLLQSEAVTCKPDEWNNHEKLTKVFDRHIKSRKLPNTMVNWSQLFHDWYKQDSSIIQFPSILAKIYPEDYKLQDKELRAWRAMFKACGCSNITPFSHEESQIEFWNKAYNDKADRQILENLYNAKLLNIDNKKEDLLWKSFRDAINSNKRGQNGKIRILSIIAPKFKYKDLIQELGVSK
ncbi:unnamed protein product [Rhizophagus irregularis]|nr:unnamed protein product [Rhizophagus irregularis]